MAQLETSRVLWTINWYLIRDKYYTNPCSQTWAVHFLSFSFSLCLDFSRSKPLHSLIQVLLLLLLCLILLFLFPYFSVCSWSLMEILQNETCWKYLVFLEISDDLNWSDRWETVELIKLSSFQISMFLVLAWDITDSLLVYPFFKLIHFRFFLSILLSCLMNHFISGWDTKTFEISRDETLWFVIAWFVAADRVD